MVPSPAAPDVLTRPLSQRPGRNPGGSYLLVGTADVGEGDREVDERRCLTRTGTFDDLDELATTRARVISATFDVVDRIAGYGWDLARLRGHLLELNSAMSMELERIAKPMPKVGR